MKKKLKFDKNNCLVIYSDKAVVNLQPKRFLYVVKMYENGGVAIKSSKELSSYLILNSKINKKFKESGFPFRIVKNGKLKTNSLTYKLVSI